MKHAYNLHMYHMMNHMNHMMYLMPVNSPKDVYASSSSRHSPSGEPASRSSPPCEGAGLGRDTFRDQSETCFKRLDYISELYSKTNYQKEIKRTFYFLFVSKRSFNV